MSRIGRLPVEIPAGVTVSINNGVITVKGPKGELSFNYRAAVNVEVGEKEITVSIKDEAHRNLYGLTRTLINNMVIGVSKGFEKELEIHGVGYRANNKGKDLELSLGYSHPILYKVPDGVEVEMNKDKKNVITVKGIDKQKVGQVSAEIRSFRPPEPYKGKGIRYMGEHIVRKAGKSASK